jgi:ribosomal protein S18 acetylase RimI-like enzyme
VNDWTLRRAQAADAAFLRRVYASTRTDELAAATGWLPAQIDALLKMQFDAQDRHYRLHHPGARFDIVQVDSVDVGRLYVERGAELRLIDISLLPSHRGRGLGTKLLHSLMAQADAAQLCLSLQVASDNPARRLYERLGFVALAEDGVYVPMRREPATAAAEGAEPFPLAA